MTKKPYLNIHLLYLLLSFLTVPTVIAIFKNIHPKNIAAIYAGSVFVLLSLSVIFMEFHKRRKLLILSLSFWGAFLFMLLFSLPMLITRVLNFHIDFENLEILYMNAQQFHKVSNYGFIMMTIIFLFDWFKHVKSGSAT